MRFVRLTYLLLSFVFFSSTLSFAGFTSITCTLNVVPGSGPAPLSVTATGSCTGGGGTLQTMLNWGDGSTTPGASGQHTYFSPGFFTVTLSATDQFENFGQTSQDVNVLQSATLLASVGNGKVAQINPDGSQAFTLDTGAGGSITGMMFDSNGNLYTTDFTAGKVSLFNFFTDGKRAAVRSEANIPPSGNFGPPFNCQPESIAQDNSGYVYVGLAGCNKSLMKLDAQGNVLGSYKVAIEDQGADWIDVAADECTVYYTSEGKRVLRFNTCGGYQLTDFAAGFHKALAVRLLPDGGVIVADNVDIHRTDATGKIIKTYDQPGEDCWTALTLDSDGTTFWSADACTSHIYHFNLNSGDVITTIKPNVPPNSMYGLAVNGSAINFLGFLGSSPSSASVSSGGSATFDISLGLGDIVRGQAQLASTTPDMLILACSNLPKGALCQFNPAQIPVTGGTSKLTITTNNTQIISQKEGLVFRPRYLAFAFPFMLGGWFLGRKRTRGGVVAITLLMTIALVVLFACGTTNLTNSNTGAGPVGAPSPGLTPAGTYTINVVAGNGPTQTSTTVSLTVK